MGRASTFFGLALLAGGGAFFFLTTTAGCNAQLATVLSSDDAATNPSGNPNTPGCTSGNCVDGSADGNTNPKTGTCPGVCLAKGDSPPPTYRPATAAEGTCPGTNVCWVIDGPSPTGQACVQDQDCNPSPEISALHGECFHGICVCNIGSVQPNGKCGSAITDCKDQGGTCHQQPATCPAGKVKSNEPTNMTCGDFIEAVCCLDPAKCKGPSINSQPVNFACCGPAGGGTDPICVNGWKTCPANYTPVDTSKGGCI